MIYPRPRPELGHIPKRLDPITQAIRPVTAKRLGMETTSEHEAAVLLGRRGGSAKTPAKAAASRANGKLGGRPRKPAPDSLPRVAPACVIIVPRKEAQQ